MRGISLRHFELYGSDVSAKNGRALELESAVKRMQNR